MKKFLATALVIILCLSAFLFVGCNTPSSAPYIGENGNWWVGETDLGVKAQGQDGAPGKDGHTPQRGVDYWTEEDVAQMKTYIEDAVLGGAW